MILSNHTKTKTMCTLTKEIEQKQFTGYKVAYKNKITGKYYSPAMGIEYKPNMKIPNIKKQNRIGSFFCEDILTSPFLFKEKMVGRTAVFKSLVVAKKLYRDIHNGISFNDAQRELYEVCILEMTIKKDLMKGYYEDNGNVVAGKIIVKLKEIKL